LKPKSLESNRDFKKKKKKLKQRYSKKRKRAKSKSFLNRIRSKRSQWESLLNKGRKDCYSSEKFSAKGRWKRELRRWTRKPTIRCKQSC